MTYVAIVCSACGAPKLAEARHESSECPRCGKRIELSAAVVLARAESVAEAEAAIGTHNAKLAGDGALYARDMRLRQALAEPRPSRPGFDRVLREARGVSGENDRADATVRALTRELGGFDAATLGDAFEALGIPRARAEVHLKRLLSKGDVFEPAPGRYRAV
ncbi:MAG: DUF5817 domain-containing protein [Methanobacteriota archaeon]